MESQGPIIQGTATFYGVFDGYGLEDSLGCTGQLFNPCDAKTAARPYSSPFECGDLVEVCDSDSCIQVEIRDSCPGCDASGIVLDLAYGAMLELSPPSSDFSCSSQSPVYPGSGVVEVTIKELTGNR